MLPKVPFIVHVHFKPCLKVRKQDGKYNEGWLDGVYGALTPILEDERAFSYAITVTLTSLKNSHKRYRVESHLHMALIHDREPLGWCDAVNESQSQTLILEIRGVYD
ncbi:MAG: hypothetical protein COB26_06360 [Piscirickettsiaceae bacterium]|nr:MAG: hypothetical protein COB26_06360 [Piscirickettsiaceae bacterium]